jgi:hypothetical protein
MPSADTSANLGRGWPASTVGEGRAGGMTALVEMAWLLAATAAMLAPALLWGRPFVFGDTPYYWAWGGDILDALQRPWPHPGQLWVTGRSLHGWGFGTHDATPADLRFNLTVLTARSAFYAVPLYLLTKAGSLWLVAGLQSLIAAWTLKVAARAAVPASTDLMYFFGAVAIAASTSLGFEAGYAMPDVFGGLALLAAAVLIAFPNRLSRSHSIGLAAVVAYAVLCHAENALNIAAAIGLGWLLHRRAGSGSRIAAQRVAPVGAALVFGLVTVTMGGLVMGAVFGRPTHMAPFAISRMLANGGVQSYLRQACAHERLTACDLAGAAPGPADYYRWVYPLEGAPPVRLADSTRYTLDQFDRLEGRHVTDAEADRRQRFVEEEGRMVIGALRFDGLAQARSAIADGAIAFINFGVDHTFDTVQTLVREGASRMRGEMAEVLPGGVECLDATTCGRFDLDRAWPIQYGLVICAFLFVAICGLRRDLRARDELATFILLILGLVLANAFLCGAISGPFNRYQARVIWLIPLCALLLAAQHWQRQRTLRTTTPPS